MRNASKWVIRLAIIFLCVTVLSSCSIFRPIDGPLYGTPEGKMLVYDKNDVPDGYYVYKNELFYPILTAGLSPTIPYLQWFTEYDNLIPAMQEGDKLVLVQSKPPVPGRFVFTAMDDVGWTIGARFGVRTDELSRSESNRYYFAGEYSPFSPIGDYLKQNISEPQRSELDKINGQPFVPNMVNSGGIMVGLTRDAMYEIRYYYGTRYWSISLKADTHAYIGGQTYETEGATPEESVYFSIQLPQGLPSGYYVVNGIGMFSYRSTGSEMP